MSKSKVVVPKVIHNRDQEAPEENEYTSKDRSIEGTNRTSR